MIRPVVLCSVALLLGGCGGVSAVESTAVPPAAPATLEPLPTLEPVVIPLSSATPPAPTAAQQPVPTAAVVPSLVPTAAVVPSPTLQPFDVSVFPSDLLYTDIIGFQAFLTGDVPEEAIRSVTITYSRQGIPTYQRTDTVAPFCSFGDGECEQWDFAANDNRWPDGTPAASGEYVALAEATSIDGRIGGGERQFTLELSGATPDGGITLLPDTGTAGDELAFEAVVQDASTVQQVDFSIVAPDGSTVHTRTERNVRYCAFGGGDNGSACGVWRFSEQGNAWPDGAQVDQTAPYTLNATAIFTDGSSASASISFSVVLP